MESETEGIDIMKAEAISEGKDTWESLCEIHTALDLDGPKDFQQILHAVVVLRERCYLAESQYEDLKKKLEENPVPNGIETLTGYESLAGVLTGALLQAGVGKGKCRHADDGEPFEKQKICEITRRVGLGYPLGQAIKKAVESQRLGDRGPAEILGAINYLAAAYLVMDEELKAYPMQALSVSQEAAVEM